MWLFVHVCKLYSSSSVEVFLFLFYSVNLCNKRDKWLTFCHHSLNMQEKTLVCQIRANTMALAYKLIIIVATTASVNPAGADMLVNVSIRSPSVSEERSILLGKMMIC